MQVREVETVPIPGQAPGTSGLRKRSRVFEQPHYVENFVQSILDTVGESAVRGSTMICGGDGRYLTRPTVCKVASLCAAAGVSRLVVGMGGLLSTPAVSNLIIRRRALGGFILTASHNPGGPEGDFGIKYNVSNGGPAPDAFTAQVHDRTREIRTYRLAEMDADALLGHIGEHPYGDDGTGGEGGDGRGFTSEMSPCPGFTVEVVDPAGDYIDLARSLFDFDSLSLLLSRSDFTFAFDAMHGVTGPYARRLFVTELGAPESAVRNAVPKPDFGGGHPDPNLAHASGIVRLTRAGGCDLAAACDGDGDRCMILGSGGVFVNPSDSVAVVAARGQSCIPYFARGDAKGVRGVARSMPTSQALDAVARKRNLALHEVPTGWKYFSSLLDAGAVTLCGEESFGLGCGAIREKDGLFACLAWLSIVAREVLPVPIGSRGNPPTTQGGNGQSGTGGDAAAATTDTAPALQIGSVRAILESHWREFGRHYFARHDYEAVDASDAETVFSRVRALVEECAAGSGLVGHAFEAAGRKFELESVDSFAYQDPVNGARASDQGLRFVFRDDSRIVFRKSGTGSSGVTVRVYFERYVESAALDLARGDAEVIGAMIDIADEISGITETLGEPTVRT